MMINSKIKLFYYAAFFSALWSIPALAEDKTEELCFVAKSPQKPLKLHALMNLFTNQHGSSITGRVMVFDTARNKPTKSIGFQGILPYPLSTKKVNSVQVHLKGQEPFHELPYAPPIVWTLDKKPGQERLLIPAFREGTKKENYHDVTGTIEMMPCQKEDWDHARLDQEAWVKWDKTNELPSYYRPTPKPEVHFEVVPSK